MKVEWKKILGAVAPTIATALGGPLAGAAIGAVSQAVLGKEDGTEEEIAAVVASGKPEILLKLKEADIAFKTKMAELGIKVEELAQKDRESARNREAQVKDNMPKVLAVLAVLGFYGAAIGLIVVAIPPEKENLVYLLAGAMIATFKDVYGYYFGSSSGSNQKNAIFSDALKGK